MLRDIDHMPSLPHFPSSLPSSLPHSLPSSSPSFHLSFLPSFLFLFLLYSYIVLVGLLLRVHPRLTLKSQQSPASPLGFSDYSCSHHDQPFSYCPFVWFCTWYRGLVPYMSIYTCIYFSQRYFLKTQSFLHSFLLKDHLTTDIRVIFLAFCCVLYVFVQYNPTGITEGV